MGRLTQTKIRGFDRPGLYGDGDTLFLKVTVSRARKSIARYWIQRVTIRGRRCDIGLGPWPLVSLQDARDAAIDNRRAIRAGGDPLAERVRSRRVPTFREAAEAVITANRDRWRGGKTEANWTGQMTRYAFPIMGDLPVDRITQADVLACLKPIWSKKAETARKLRMRIRQVLQWAEAHGHVTRNVAGDAIGGALPAMPAKNKNRRALPYAETGAALAAVAEGGASEAVKLCFRFAVLTACRSGEARGATWAEIDLDRREWRIPADRMKAEAEHRIPLSDAAVAVLESARELADGSALVFPSPHRAGKPLSDMALTQLLRKTGLADRATVHGFRTSFRTWAAEQTNAPHAVMELSLAHQVGSAVERAYARSDLLEKRRGLMQQWANYLTRPPVADNVTELNRARQ